MKPIPRRSKGSFTLTVAPEHLASQFEDATLPPVLATPVMIMAMENAALNAIRPFLEPTETALGAAVEIRHLAATPVGQRVRAEAEATGVQGRRVQFTVSARDESEDIGRGRHQRVVVDYDRIAARVATKRKS